MLAAACVVLVTAAACGGDGPTEPVKLVPSISFTYTGAESGTFAVTGSGGPNREGAIAVRIDGSPKVLFVAGTRMRSAAHVDYLDLVLPEVTAPRTFSFAGDCTSIEDCPMSRVGIDQPVEFDFRAPELNESFFVFTAGTVTVTTVSATRLAGTFQGTAETLTFEGTPRSITITNGRFDLPLMSIEDLE